MIMRHSFYFSLYFYYIIILVTGSNRGHLYMYYERQWETTSRDCCDLDIGSDSLVSNFSEVRPFPTGNESMMFRLMPKSQVLASRNATLSSSA